MNKKYYITISSFLCICFSLHGISYNCASSDDIQNALDVAAPGDNIIINAGTYTRENISINGKSCHFGSTKSGTAYLPITIKSADSFNMAVLSGSDVAGSYVFYIFDGDYWIIQELEFTGAQKGIVLDNSNNTRISNCKVYGTGMEGIHIRDGSSNCCVEACTISDTGLNTPGYGEGVYVGTDKGSWDTYNPACYDTIITNSVFGPNVTAEHIDIKEGTRRTIVENCVFNGTGITGENSATTYVSCKGIDAIVRYNTCYRNGNTVIDSAFSCNNRGVEDSGTGNWFYYNTVYNDDAEAWVVRTKQGTCTYKVWSNNRIPEGNMYQTYTGSSYTEVDPGGTQTPVPTPVFILGDVNRDTSVNIIDALVTAQYYVGLNPVNFSLQAADVNSDNVVNIIDALLIAQYYVGLIPGF